MLDPLTLAAVALGTTIGGGLALSAWRAAGRQRRHQAALDKSGHAEPVSLHPRIDEHKCICTGACVTVCPEKDVLGLIDGKPRLLRPSACIGHGECMRACPVEAIALVIGSARRGVDLPLLGADFQTNQPGLYIAGELGGMGLIHNAVNQGAQAMRAIGAALAAETPRLDGVADALVVGAGPAGLAAALQAKALGLTCEIVDQEQLGGALRSFPRQKIVMTAPCDLPLHGRVALRRTTKEALLKLWQDVVARQGLRIEGGVKVEGIARGSDGEFTVATSRGARRARKVLLAIGRRGSPRKLGVPGEGLPKVTYQLIEPEQYAGRRCLVVGGGDSAAETALALAAQPGASVTLAHRGDQLDRCKPDNHDAVLAARARGAIDLRLATRPIEITADDVALEAASGAARVANDFVFICVGGELPTAWLHKIGIEVRTLRGEALPSAGQA